MTEVSNDLKAGGKLQGKEADVLPEKRAPTPLIVRGVSGKVSWYSVNKGFGFIQRDDGEPDVFVHSSAIVRNSRHSRILSENEKVEFDVINGHKGPEAAVVTGKGGRVVSGYTFIVSGQLRFNRGRGRERQFKGRHGQASDAKESGAEGTSSDESCSSKEDSADSSDNRGSNSNVDEKDDGTNLHKGSEVKQDSKPEDEQPTLKQQTSKQPTKGETAKKAKESQLKQESKEEQQASQQSTKSESSKNSKPVNLKKDQKPKAEQLDAKQTSKNEPSKNDKQVQPKQDLKLKADKQAPKPTKIEPAESK